MLTKKSKTNRNGDRWSLSYAALMTILFALFVVLYAQSKAKPQAANATATSVPQQSQVLTQAHEAIQESLKQESGVTDLNDKVQFSEDDRGLIVRLAARDFFDDGVTEPRVELHPLLDRIAKVLVTIPNSIRIEGHTDIEEESLNQGSAETQGWELSANRATWVVKYWIKRFGFDPSRLSAAGFSHFHPLTQRKDDYSRGKNRRVEIIVLKDQK